MVYGFNHLFESFESYFFIYAFKDLWHSFAFETFFLSLRFVSLCTSYMCNIQRIFVSQTFDAHAAFHMHISYQQCVHLMELSTVVVVFVLKKNIRRNMCSTMCKKNDFKTHFRLKKKVSKIWALIKFKKSQMHINHSLILIQTIGTFIIFLLLFLNFLWIKLKLNYDFAIFIQENKKLKTDQWNKKKQSSIISVFFHICLIKTNTSVYKQYYY